MIYPVFSMHDSGLKAFSQPFFNRDDQTAIFLFTLFLNTEYQDKESRARLSLFQIGEFDDQSARFVSTDKRLLVEGVNIELPQQESQLEA